MIVQALRLRKRRRSRRTLPSFRLKDVERVHFSPSRSSRSVGCCSTVRGISTRARIFRRARKQRKPNSSPDGALMAGGRDLVRVRPAASMRTSMAIGPSADPVRSRLFAAVFSDRPLETPISDAIALGTFRTRLETRTKESSVCASHWDTTKPKGEMKVNVRLVRTEGRPPVVKIDEHSRGVSFSLRDEAHQERTRWDPKDGELCLVRTKSGETLMEVRSDSDVQIDRRNWV